MVYGAESGAVAAAGETAMAEAIKASGAIVSVEPGDFEVILGKVEAPLVVIAQGGVFKTKYHYLTPYKGLIFYTRTPITVVPATKGRVDRRPRRSGCRVDDECRGCGDLVRSTAFRRERLSPTRLNAVLQTVYSIRLRYSASAGCSARRSSWTRSVLR